MSSSDENRSRVRIEQFLSAARDGSNSALGRLFDACRPQLLRAARRAIGRNQRGPIGASDLVQETLVNAMQRFSTFQGTHSGELLAWLRTIMTRKVVDYSRRHDAQARAHTEHLGRQRGVDGIATRNGSNGLSGAESRELLRAMIAALTPDYREVLRLRFDSELSFREIGLRLGISEDGARMRFSRAVRRLAREMPRDAWDT